MSACVLSVSHLAKEVFVRPGLFTPEESFVYAQNLEPTQLSKGSRLMYGNSQVVITTGLRVFEQSQYRST